MQASAVHIISMCSENVWVVVVAVTIRYVDVMQWMNAAREEAPHPTGSLRGFSAGSAWGVAGVGQTGLAHLSLSPATPSNHCHSRSRCPPQVWLRLPAVMHHSFTHNMCASNTSFGHEFRYSFSHNMRPSL